MGVGTALRALGRFLDDCEERDVVNSVKISGREDAGDAVSATIELVFDTCAPPEESSVSPTSASVGADGSLSVSFTSTAALIPVEEHNVDLEPARVSSTLDGATVVELRASVPNGADIPETEVDRDAAHDTEDANTATRHDEPVEINESSVAISVAGGNPNASNASQSGTVSSDRESGTESRNSEPASGETSSTQSRDVPPFRDTELLQEVYDSCDTFSEMPEALGMDVTAETARRYMIRQGIHEPTSYNTSEDDTDNNADDAGDDTTGSDGEADDTNDESPGDALDSTRSDSGDTDESEPPTNPPEELESPAVLADGIGLPDDVTIDTIVEAVQTSNTIYEVKQGIGIEREDALEMLRKLNLLEFVAGRLATEAEREVSRDQIINRLREQADSL